MLIYFILSAIILFSNDMQSNDFLLVPEKINGWQNAKVDKIYNRNNIYDYLDGGAELYLAYNMELLFSRRLSKKGETDIVVDIFRMKSSKDAFGLFSHDYEGNELKIGNGSAYEMGLLIFWKGKYYVSILAETESKEAKETVIKLANIIASNISESGYIPSIVNRLKASEYKLISKHYFQSHYALNFYYYISDSNILNLSDKVEGVVGKYEIGNAMSYVIAIQYENDKEASKALLNYYAKYLKTSGKSTSVIFRDGKWFGAKQIDKFLILSLDAPSKESALKLIDTIRER